MRRKSRIVFSFSIQTTKPCGGAQPGRRLCVKDYRFKTLITTLLHFSTGRVILQYPPRKFRPAVSAARAARTAAGFGPSVTTRRPRTGRSGTRRSCRFCPGPYTCAPTSRSAAAIPPRSVLHAVRLDVLDFAGAAGQQNGEQQHRRQNTPLSTCKSLFHRVLSFRVSRPAPRPGRSSRAACRPHSAGSRSRSRTFPARRTARAAPP